MKSLTMVSTLFLGAVSFLASSTSAHIAMSNPPGQAGPWSKNPSGNVHAWIGFEGKKFPCGGYPDGPVTTLRAGQVLPVRFWNFNIKDHTKFPPPNGLAQSRHGGGACEFSLSSDGGRTWHVVGQYTKTCPDIYYEWPVLIPLNVPSCLDSQKCLFSFSWTAFATSQFYHHCANVVVLGASDKVLASSKKVHHRKVELPELEMTVVDVKQLGQKTNVNADGDQKQRSTGPSRVEREKNLGGFYECGGGAAKTGVDLNLNVHH